MNDNGYGVGTVSQSDVAIFGCEQLVTLPRNNHDSTARRGRTVNNRQDGFLGRVDNYCRRSPVKETL
uniref:Uncharacterized protein n=1 Tax=Romanomermis culicivorax TaxID=13658 RepID=A0A915KGW2_ROMCU